MDELDDIRQRRLGQLRQQAQEQAEFQQQVQALEAGVKQHLSRDALARYGNIKAVDGQKAVQVCLVLAQLIKEQRMANITDEQLKIILQQMAHKREPTIRFR